MVLDETAELKKGTKTVGVARQHAGITGQVENCQTVVFLAYVTARAHALLDFRLYLPKAWCADRERRERARVPDGVEFTTKPALGTAMVAGAAGAGVPFAWVAGDEVYGRSSKLWEACEKDRKGYECFAHGKGQAGLDQYQVRLWHSFHRHTVLSMCAQALLAIAAARPALPGSDPPASTAGQPAAWRDTGNFPPARMTSPPATTPAWSRSASPRPAAWPASPPRP